MLETQPSCVVSKPRPGGLRFVGCLWVNRAQEVGLQLVGWQGPDYSRHRDTESSNDNPTGCRQYSFPLVFTTAWQVSSQTTGPQLVSVSPPGLIQSGDINCITKDSLWSSGWALHGQESASQAYSSPLCTQYSVASVLLRHSFFPPSLCWILVVACGLSLVPASGGLLSSCDAQASHFSGFSCCRARALEHRASVVTALRLSSCGTRA